MVFGWITVVILLIAVPILNELAVPVLFGLATLVLLGVILLSITYRT